MTVLFAGEILVSLKMCQLFSPNKLLFSLTINHIPINSVCLVNSEIQLTSCSRGFDDKREDILCLKLLRIFDD